MYYPCSENKGADQLCGYHEADLRLCFGICKKQFFFMTRHIYGYLFQKHLNNLNKITSNLLDIINSAKEEWENDASKSHKNCTTTKHTDLWL